MIQTYIKLNDGNKIPQFGLGVYQVPEGEATINSVKTALEMGVRHIDTAHAYQNERSVGRAVKESGIPREEVWITTKLWPSEYGEGKTSQAIDKMLKRLDTDYIDLLLLHQQFGDYVGAYKDMQKAVKDGRVKSIGLSNFESERLEEVLAMAEIPPSVLQVECHPYYQQNELKKRIEKYGTVIESWYPIGHGDKNLINEPLFTKLGQKYGKTNVQIILRWHIQEGTIVFPRSTNPVHIKENFEIFDFELTQDEMNEIRKLDSGKRFFNMTLEQQEQMLGSWKPED
ncbi:aldo/keto reductase [bacterium]|nr:aldo/keto reductase [bacterium]